MLVGSDLPEVELREKEGKSMHANGERTEDHNMLDTG